MLYNNKIDFKYITLFIIIVCTVLILKKYYLYFNFEQTLNYCISKELKNLDIKKFFLGECELKIDYTLQELLLINNNKLLKYNFKDIERIEVIKNRYILIVNSFKDILLPIDKLDPIEEINNFINYYNSIN